MNTGIFTGNIGRDAETNNTHSGDTVTNFSIGVNIGTKKQPETMWVSCQLWKDRGVALAPYLLKGTKVTVIGRITLRTYTKKDGTVQAEMSLAVNDVDLHGSRNQDQAEYERHDSPKPSQVAQKQRNDDELDDEIPF